MSLLVLFFLAAPNVVDLTHVVSANIPTFDAKPQFAAKDIGTADYSMRSIQIGEHTGTHVDAPAHFIKNRATVDAIPAASLVAPAVIIDVRAKVEDHPDYRVGAADLQAWEKKNGKIPYGAVVIAVTGWSRHWVSPDRYRNPDAKGVLHFPGFGEDAVDWLIQNRPRVAALGIDTLSIDYGPSETFEVHKKSHGAGFYHIENLDRPERLPAKGATIVVGVIPFERGSGAPARVLAILPGEAKK